MVSEYILPLVSTPLCFSGGKGEINHLIMKLWRHGTMKTNSTKHTVPLPASAPFPHLKELAGSRGGLPSGNMSAVLMMDKYILISCQSSCDVCSRRGEICRCPHVAPHLGYFAVFEEFLLQENDRK